MPARVLSDVQIAEAKRLRHNEPKSWPLWRLADRYGCAEMTIWNAFNPERARENWRRQHPPRGDKLIRAERKDAAATRTPDPLMQRLKDIPPDTRDLTARFFGDPLPGRSALDQKRKQEAGQA